MDDVSQAPNSTISQVIDGAGPITGLFVLLVFLGLLLLMRSMSRQLRKVDPELPDGPDDLERKAGEAAIEEAVERGAEGAGGEQPPVR